MRFSFKLALVCLYIILSGTVLTLKSEEKDQYTPDKSIISNDNEWNTVSLLNNAETLLQNEKYDSCGILLREAYHRINAKTDYTEASKCYNLFGALAYRKGEFETGLQYCDSALAFDSLLIPPKTLSSLYNLKGMIMADMGKHDLSIENYLKSIHIDESLGNKFDIALGYNNIGNILKKESDFERALEYFESAQKIFTELLNQNESDSAKVQTGLATVLNNSANVISYQARTTEDEQIRKDKFKEAENQYSLAASYFEKSGNLLNAASAYNNIGFVEYYKKDYEKALTYFF